MGGIGGGYSESDSNSRSDSGVQYYGGQEEALAGLFAPGGTFSQFMKGKPNPGVERAQATGLEQLKARQSAAGVLNTPLGTRQQSDYLQKTTGQAGDNWLATLFQFMQPAGTQSHGWSSGSSMGINGNVG